MNGLKTSNGWGNDSSKRRLRRAVVFLITASALLDATWALAPSDAGHVKQRTQQQRKKGDSVLPPMVESRRRRNSNTNGPRSRNKKKKLDTDAKFEERPLPTRIPRLSEILNERQGSKPRREQENQKEYEAHPWKASFQASIRTQGRIKKEFSISRNGESPTGKAKRILRALLSTHPTQCNAANVVGALTFSAKALGAQRVEKDDDLRNLVFQTLDVLHILVEEQLLSTRQLCNACWAIAKHYDRDHALLPPPPELVAASTAGASVVGIAETWDILDDDISKTYQRRNDATIDEIAQQLTDILHEPQDAEDGEEAQQQAKIGEICMASWAFGKLRHRKTPPGWQTPPQLGRYPNTNDAVIEKKKSQTTDLITFEQWGSFGNTKKEDPIEEENESALVTGQLFDAIAFSLCRSPEAYGVFDEHTSDIRDVHTANSCLSYCSWSELANVGWSFAAHGSCKSSSSVRLLQDLAKEARRRLSVGGIAMKGFLIRDIAQLLWALGTLQADNFRLADDLVDLVESLSDYLRLSDRAPSFGRGRPLARWSCADLVQVALSLAHARIDELPLLRAIFDESHHRLLEGMHHDFDEREGRNSFRPWEVSILLWAQARLHLKQEQGGIFEDFASDAPRFLLSSLSPQRPTLGDCGIEAQEQANIVWSLTVLEHHRSQEAVELINRIYHEAADACSKQNSIQLEHAHQLWQAYFVLEEESPDCVANVPSWFTDYLREKWSLEKSRDKLSSARHKSLSQTLSLMGVQHFNEHDEDIDVAIVLKDDAAWTHETDPEIERPSGQVSVAVEFDGPNHFTREKDSHDKANQPRALGHTVLKYRLLKKQGWSVVRVPYYEFDRIPFWASMERQRYLQRKLKTHANIRFSEVDVSEYKALQGNKQSRFD